MPTETAGVTSSSGTTQTVYGGLEGPESMYLKLISSDGHEFVVRRDFAITASPTIKNMLSGLLDNIPNRNRMKSILKIFLLTYLSCLSLFRL